MIIPAASLYIHIPYCRTKCDYCDFFSRPWDGNIPDQYIDRIMADISRYAGEGWFAPLKTIYIGGGTPSLLLPEQIASLMNRIAWSVPVEPDAEITLEANPEDIGPAFLQALAGAGISRLSLGIQSLCDEALKGVRRRGNRARCLEALESARTLWPGSFSCDMIAGLPQETQGSFLQGLRRVIDYCPSHISLYALTVSEGTPLCGQISSGTIPDPEESSETQWIAGRDLLEQAGYRQYEVSNFAKPGAESRHNLAYWRSASYLGAGDGAVGSLYRTGGTGIRFNGDGREDLDQKTAVFEYLMMGFRTGEGISSKRFFERFGILPETRIGASEKGGAFTDWEGRGLAQRYGDSEAGVCYALKPKGLLFLNRFLRELLE
jgi:oxygen-independent coproporphyrinogen-3 oxidase